MHKDPLARLRRLVATVEDVLLAVLLTGMIVLAVAQIALRNLAETGISWSDPILRLSVLWVTLLGAMAATREDNHIRVDVLPRLLSLRARAYVKRLTDLISAAVCGLITWHAGRFVRSEFHEGGVLYGVIPAWVAEVIIPVGFAVIALRFVVNAAFPRQQQEEQP